MLVTTISIDLLLLLLQQAVLSLASSGGYAALILTYSPLHPLPLVTYGVEQARTCVRIILMLRREHIIIIKEMFKVLLIRSVKLRPLKLPEFVIHHALSEKVEIDLAHVVYRFVGRPRRGRAASRSLRLCRSVLRCMN